MHLYAWSPYSARLEPNEAGACDLGTKKTEALARAVLMRWVGHTYQKVVAVALDIRRKLLVDVGTVQTSVNRVHDRLGRRTYLRDHS